VISDHYNEGLHVDSGSNPTMTIKDCIITNNGYYGIFYTSPGVFYMTGTNVTQHIYYGLHSNAANNVTIHDCHFEKVTNDWAVIIYYAYQLTITHTTFEDNRKYNETHHNNDNIVNQ
jgi:hypothetical protein